LRLHLAVEHVLQPDIDRQAQRFRAVFQVVVERLLDAGNAVAVDIGITDDLRDLAALGIEAALVGFERDARNAELVDLILLARRQVLEGADVLFACPSHVLRCRLSTSALWKVPLHEGQWYGRAEL
jgi:hypothetical protein